MLPYRTLGMCGSAYDAYSIDVVTHIVEVVKLLLDGNEDLRMTRQVLPEPGGSGLLRSDAEEVGQPEPVGGPGPAAYHRFSMRQ